MSQGFFNTVQMRILGGLFILMGMIALGSYASLNFEKIQHLDPYRTTISVTGEGEVTAVPDIGTFTFSVGAEAETASVAQEESGTRINDIIAYLTEAGVAEADIKTEAYTLFPRWRYEERVCAAGASYCPPGERVQDGFEVNQTVSVKVRETDRAGDIIAGVGERGVTNISGLDFTTEDPSALQAEAREAAIQDAQGKAALLAQQLGVRLVKLSGYYEETGDVHLHDEYAMAVEGRGGEALAPDLPTGEQNTVVRVNVSYEVQ